jgi:hypothetical protein
MRFSADLLMSDVKYPMDRTAYLRVDPYNDFLSEGGKVYPLFEPIAQKVWSARQSARARPRHVPRLPRLT